MARTRISIGAWGIAGIAAAAAMGAFASDLRQQVREEVGKAAVRHGVDTRLAHAVAKVESGFQPAAVSSKGAVGVMQLMPGTAMTLGVDPWNARQNIDGGVRYLASLLGLYGGNVRLALAAYNAGPQAVERYRGVPPYKETQQYVELVMGEYAGRTPPAKRSTGESGTGRRGAEPKRDPCARSVAVLGLDGEWTSLDREPAPTCSN